jgi:hypothetical protein
MLVGETVSGQTKMFKEKSVGYFVPYGANADK